MEFYKVKKEYDNRPLKGMVLYVCGELFTKKECKEYGVNMDFVEKVDVPKDQTFFFFGARFQEGDSIM